MDFKRAVGDRRTTRWFQPYHPVEPEKIQTILEAARLQSQHGNASDIRKAVVVDRSKISPELDKGLVECLYNQPAAAQAPVHIYWCIDMSGWKQLKPHLMELIEVGALTHSYGWSEEFIDGIVMPTPDFNVMSGDRRFAEWLSAFECGLAVGSALLAAVDQGLATSLLTGTRDKIRELLGMPADVTVTEIQIVGYPAESAEAGGQRPRPDYETLYFEGRWGAPLKRDPKVVEELTEAGMIQPSAPLPWRKQEIRALAAMFGMPE
jgi:nitroreductase